MKKLIGCLLPLLLCGAVQAEMFWFGLNPSPQAGNAGDSGQVTQFGLGDPQRNWDGSYGGFEVEIKVVDSLGGDDLAEDSSSGTWYTHAVNTEDVGSATGFIEIIAITDTSTTTGHLFNLAGGDSTFVRYVVKTGYRPYDANAFTIKATAAVVAVTGTAGLSPLTFTFEGDEGVDTLFKAWTWIEFTCWDSTTWSDDVAGPYDSSVTPSWTSPDTVTLSGTYSGNGELGRYHVRMFGATADTPDSIIWTHYGNQDHVTSVETTAVTGSAQLLDSGMSVNFDAVDTGTDDDVFIFHVSDSLHYGKTVKYKIRAALNVHRKR